MIDEIDGALGNGKGAVDVILKMVCICMLVLGWSFGSLKFRLSLANTELLTLCSFYLRRKI